jgi:F420-dependent oxidoreductase-like protein
MDIGLMIEGQNGLNWARWTHIYQLAERLKFPSLFRSDHYFIGDQQDSLDPYISLAIAARETKNIRLGTLVSPMTFRPPVEIARMAAAIDLLSGGRFVLGMGAGWNEPEHVAYGIRFPERGERSARLLEAVELVRALWSPGPANFSGKYYQLSDANMMPKPAVGRPWLLVGGSGPQRTLKVAARFADEWNCVNTPVATYAERAGVLDAHCATYNRDPSTIKRSMMTFGIVGPNEKALMRAAEVASQHVGRGQYDAKELLAVASERGVLHGTTDQVLDQLGKLSLLGVAEVQFQHMDFDNDEVPEYLASEIAPRVKNL